MTRDEIQELVNALRKARKDKADEGMFIASAYMRAGKFENLPFGSFPGLVAEFHELDQQIEALNAEWDEAIA